MNRTVLVLNAGSSSIKYQLIEVATGASLASGLVERIGEPVGQVKHQAADGAAHSREAEFATHTAGLQAVLELFTQFGPDLTEAGLVAVGHRIVQGGDRFDGPALITAEVEAAIDELGALAPLHNPPNLEGVRAARTAFPDVPQVAVFDTAFHRTMPPAAYTYAIPVDLAKRYGIRRYGMHGTSHQYVSRELAHLLGKDPAEVNVIVLHLGNGGSVTAVRAGRSVETSMGMTPLEGLVMGTRSGDIDPAILVHLGRVAGMSLADLDVLLNKRSGMLGLTGSSDLRDVHAAADAGDERAQIGLAVYAHRIRSYVGAYFAQLGHLDAIAFTAGVGENDAALRAESLAGLGGLGIQIDPVANANAARGQSVRISAANSAVEIWIVPTNEELEIARQAAALVDPPVS